MKANEAGWEVASSRVFDAPRERVFAMFKDPAILTHWWGPKGFTNTIHEFDLCPGGLWRLCMHGPDGRHYENTSRFLEVVEPERVVFQHLEPVHAFRMEMDFSDLAGRTELSWRMVFVENEENPAMKDFIARANQENFDRLQVCLEGKGST